MGLSLQMFLSLLRTFKHVESFTPIRGHLLFLTYYIKIPIHNKEACLHMLQIKNYEIDYLHIPLSIAALATALATFLPTLGSKALGKI